MNVPLTLLLLACSSKNDPPDGTFEVLLDRSAAIAGERVGFRARFVHEDGEAEDVSATLTSTLETTLDVSADGVRPLRAGDHVLTATGVVNDAAVSATASLAVGPAPAESLDLVFEADQTTAGVDVGWTLSGLDAFGNAADTSGAVWDVDPELTIGEGTVGSTVAGTWTATATVGTAADTATLLVEAAEPVAIDLTVVQALQSADVFVTVSDVFGNDTGAPWTLSVDGPAHGMRGRDTVVFTEEGWATFTATVDGTALSDEVGPLAIDWTAPTLTVTSPTRSDWLMPGTHRVTGTVTDAGSGVRDVTVNGIPATLEGDTFHADIETEFGLSVLDVRASDASGIEATDKRAVMAGARTPTGDWIENGIIVRIVEGDEGLGALADGMMTMFDPEVLVDALPSPLLRESESICLGFLCTTYSLTATLTDVRWADATLELDPQPDGTLLASMRFTGIEIPWTATGTLAGVGMRGSGNGTADSLELALALTFDVVDHTIDVTVTDVSVNLNALDLGLPSWVDDVADELSVDPEAIAVAELESAADAGVPTIIEETLESSLHELEIDIEWTVPHTSGATARLIAQPSAVVADAVGLNVTLESMLHSIDWRIDEVDGGPLSAGFGAPDWTSFTDSAAMAANIDTYNQMHYAIWGAGLHRQIATAEELEVDMSIFVTAFPGISELVVGTRAYLPPTLIAKEDGLYFDIPNLEFRLYDREAVPGEEVYIIHVSSFTRGEFSMRDGGLDITWDRPVIASHIERAPPEADLSFLDPALASMFAGLNLNGSRHLGTMSLPEIAGYALDGINVVRGGPEGGFIVMSGGLAAP
jgi:hypothetical protein